MRPPIFFKELGQQTSYFGGETIHFFLAISKTIYYFEQGGKQFIYFHIFLNPPDIKWSAPKAYSYCAIHTVKHEIFCRFWIFTISLHVIFVELTIY